MAIKTYLVGSLATPSLRANMPRVQELTYDPKKSKVTSKTGSSGSGYSSGGGRKDVNLPSLESALKSSSTYSTSGYSAPKVQKADISGLLAAFEQEAATNRGIAQSAYDTAVRDLETYYNQGRTDLDTAIARERENLKTGIETKRSELLKSITRFQEENAKNQENQKRAYLSEQAALESARAQADRNTRISAASRGLSGSGLQQLAQLQNLINQSQDISQLAGKNQRSMDDLRLALAREQEDYNTDLANAELAYNTNLANAEADYTSNLDKLLTTRDTGLRNAADNLTNTLASIASGLKSQKAQAEAQAESDYINALNSARAQAAASRVSKDNQYDADYKYITNYINDVKNTAESEALRAAKAAGKATKKKESSSAYKKAYDNAYTESLQKTLDAYVEDLSGFGITGTKEYRNVYDLVSNLLNK